ncbi:MAG: D-aminoacyl-tRNA deacylase, partial [Micrococcaceae bacterium]|nr:D-aminoacyl-tRNA deacylase [Micrococcaceae bacterium]
MRVVLQRVRSASVTVAGEVVADIDPEPGQGLVALVGVTHGDE